MRNRMGLLLSGTLVLASALLVGCEPPKPAEPAVPAEAPGSTAPASTAQGSGGGVAPIGSGAMGGMTPMTGTENIQGGGSGVGQAAKDQARRAAGAAAGGSISTESTE
ncbi:hypothetical protein MCEMSE15_00346 [Fimbriimonadaceae bacterium]